MKYLSDMYCVPRDFLSALCMSTYLKSQQSFAEAHYSMVIEETEACGATELAVRQLASGRIRIHTQVCVTPSLSPLFRRNPNTKLYTPFHAANEQEYQDLGPQMLENRK